MCHTHNFNLSLNHCILALQPDLISLIAGANDVLRNHWDRDEYIREMTLMIDTLTRSGVAVIISSLPDFTIRLPLPSEQKQLVKQQLQEANEATLSLSYEYKLHYIDFWNHPLNHDNTSWSSDMIHLNSRGYRDVAAVIFHRMYGDNTKY